MPSFFFADDFFSMDVVKGLNIWNALPGVFNIALHNYFIPTVFFETWLCYSLFHLNPAGYYAFIFAFHFINSLVVYLFFSRITKDRRAGFMASTIYMVFCGNWEAVGWAYGHILLCIFILLAIIGHIDKRYIIASIMYLLAVTCNETALLIVPTLILFYEYFVGNAGLLRAIRNAAVYVPMFAALILFKLYRMVYILKSTSAGDLHAGSHVIVNYLNYISTLIIPITTAYRMSAILPAPIVSTIVILKTATLLLLPLVLFILFKYGDNIMRFLAACVLIIFIPYSFIDLPITSRYMYEASVFYICLISWLASSWLKKGGNKRIIWALIIGFFMVNLGGMMVYQKLFYNKKEVRRQIVNDLVAEVPSTRPGSKLCFVDLPIREDEIKAMVNLWFPTRRHSVLTVNPDNVACKQTYSAGKKYNGDYVFVYDCREKHLKTFKSHD